MKFLRCWPELLKEFKRRVKLQNGLDVEAGGRGGKPFSSEGIKAMIPFLW